MKQYRHGDVFLEQVASPSGQQALSYRKSNLVAEGEATGHAHRAEGDFALYEVDGTLYLRAGQTTALTHEEHARIPLPEGTFRVRLQRQWTAEGWTRVAD